MVCIMVYCFVVFFGTEFHIITFVDQREDLLIIFQNVNNVCTRKMIEEQIWYVNQNESCVNIIY